MRMAPSSLVDALSASTVTRFHYDNKAVQHVAVLQFRSLLFLYGAWHIKVLRIVLETFIFQPASPSVWWNTNNSPHELNRRFVFAVSRGIFFNHWSIYDHHHHHDRCQMFFPAAPQTSSQILFPKGNRLYFDQVRARKLLIVTEFRRLWCIFSNDRDQYS